MFRSAVAFITNKDFVANESNYIIVAMTAANIVNLLLAFNIVK